MPHLKFFHLLAILVFIAIHRTSSAQENVLVEQAHEFVVGDGNIAANREHGKYVANRAQKCRDLLQQVRDQLGIQNINLNRYPAPDPERYYDLYFSGVEGEEAIPVVGFVCKATYDFLVQVLDDVTNVFVRGIPAAPDPDVPQPNIPIVHHRNESRGWGG